MIVLCEAGVGSLAEIKKMTPRQLHAAVHHIQAIRKARLADLTNAVFVGAQGGKKDLESFIRELTRDG